LIVGAELFIGAPSTVALCAELAGWPSAVLLRAVTVTRSVESIASAAAT